MTEAFIDKQFAAASLRRPPATHPNRTRPALPEVARSPRRGGLRGLPLGRRRCKASRWLDARRELGRSQYHRITVGGPKSP